MGTQRNQKTIIGQRPKVKQDQSIFYKQLTRINFAIVILTLIQIEFVYTNPVTLRANTTFTKPLIGVSQDEPYNYTSKIARSKDRYTYRATDVPTSEQRIMQPQDTGLYNGNQYQLQSSTLANSNSNNERSISLLRPTSQQQQNKQESSGYQQKSDPTRDYNSNRTSLNRLDRYSPSQMYPSSDLVSEGSGDGPLNHNSKQQSGKIDDTEDGEDDDDDDYDDKDILDSSADLDNNTGFQKPQLNNKPGNLNTNWPPDAPNNPYVPFRGPGFANTRPIYQQTNSTSHVLQATQRPHLNYSTFDTNNDNNNNRFVNQTKPPRLLTVITTSQPPDKLDMFARPPANSTGLENPAMVINDYSQKPNRTDTLQHLNSASSGINQTITTNSKPSTPTDKFVYSEPNIRKNSTNLNVSRPPDSKSKDSDIDYDYEEEMDEDDAEDTSAFEDGEPLDGEKRDNKTATSFPLDNPKQPHNPLGNSYIELDRSKVNTIPSTTTSTTMKPTTTTSLYVTSKPPLLEESTPRNPYTYGSDSSGENLDYGDEEESEEPEEEEDDLNMEEDDADNEDDFSSENDAPPLQPTLAPIIPIVTSTSSTTPPSVSRNIATQVPEKSNSDRQDTAPSNPETNRISGSNPNSYFNSMDYSTKSPKLPNHRIEISSTVDPTISSLRTTTMIPYRPKSTTTDQPITTTTTITSLLTLKPSSSPAATTTRPLSNTNWYTNSRPVDTNPGLGVTPSIINYGSGSFEDDTDLTKQIYDKAVEMYQTVQKAMVATFDAVWQPNFELNSTTFEPLLSQPLFFMLALGGAVIGLVLLMMLIVYIVSYQIQPKDDISLY